MTINRMSTRVICLIHPHRQKDPIDCSADLIAFQSSKTVKGSGGFSLTLVPRRNYLNEVGANDIVNVYVDPGDGKMGFVRVMFGYVDNVARDSNTDDNGGTSTQFIVTGTDFVKAIDKTDIYFNPALAGRAELSDPRFGISQLGGGHALRTRGITAHGTPAQLVENLLQLLLGFGAQWALPRSYPTQNFIDKTRSQRRNRAKQRLPQEIRTNLRAVFGTDIEDIGFDVDLSQTLLEKQFALSSGLVRAAANGVGSPGLLNPVAAALPTDYAAQQSAISTLLAAAVDLQAYQIMLHETSASSTASILDLLSLDFIEALSVDGYISSSSIWTPGSGSHPLSSILYGWSNEIVNELCFDLRPVAADAPDQCFGTRYSTAPDELGINTGGYGFMRSTVAAVQYTPAVVFRENPYSTVEGLDLSRFNVLGSPTGFQAFGPIFSQNPGQAGRQLYNYRWAGVDALTPEKCVFSEGSPPLKHLDVVTMVTQDMVTEHISRGDADIFNLFELSAVSPNQEMWRYIIADLLPVMTPISIQRHGLRVRSLTTKFANYSRDQLCTGGSGVDTAQTRRNIVRWTLLLDHWYQHNEEYFGGTVTLRGRPDIRVGYRLDWLDRNESYYVESVQHQWTYAGIFQTTLQLSRGQRNDPYPAYIAPILAKTGGLPAGAPDQSVENFTDQERAQRSATVAQQGGGDRTVSGRLAKSFPARDTWATSHSVGGTHKYAGDNAGDKPANVPGYAEFPNQFSKRDVSVDQQLGDYAVPIQGEDKIV